MRIKRMTANGTNNIIIFAKFAFIRDIRFDVDKGDIKNES